MNSIRRLLGEADQDCYAPVLVPSSDLLARQRLARSRFRKPANEPKEEVTKESVAGELKRIGESIRGTPDLDRWTKALENLAEAINCNSTIPFDAEISVSTTRETNVVVQPRPPEKDPVLAAILGKDPPANNKPSLEQVQTQKRQEGGVTPETTGPNQPSVPTPQDVQKAMEAAMNGQESLPKVELVESSSMSSAMGMLQMESLPAGGPLLSNPAVGQSNKVWGAFKKFLR
jgi:hypothetical protein